MFPDGNAPILWTDDCAHLHANSTPPIALCLCCYTGAFAEHADCLAEELLRSPGGPVAVYSGSSVTMPYGMAVMSRAAMHEYFVEQRPTLGRMAAVDEARHDCHSQFARLEPGQCTVGRSAAAGN